MPDVMRIARKEFHAFFASPAAFIFLGAFLAVTLFTFFWVETFFARNIADVRPLFEWMPMLLIFLVSAITMRSWSEERRAGTLELLLTSPVPPVRFVLGKFLACLGLVGVALVLTLPLPLTVAQLGQLDWGPVLGGYVATLFLAAAYVAIGLFVSARSENALVSLIATALLCGVLYGIGSDAVSALFGNAGAEVLALVGSGARFESITRGVIDLRDLYYYVSIVGVFLTLNVWVLEWLRWAGNPGNAHHRRWALLTALCAANFVAGNFWLGQTRFARVDLTEGGVYSISDATRGYLEQLREPLLIRGYFSAQTHPLLAPLVPRVRDLLLEYGVAGGDQVRVEVIDPLENPELEQEAGEKFGIRPVAFQTADKYQAAVVNSYFDIVIQYGDEYEKLGFRDLIDVKFQSETDLDVDLRNPEYDVTRAIKRVLYAYQASGNLFEGMRGQVAFRAYVSPAEKLPPTLAELRAELEALLAERTAESGGKLRVEFADPDAEGGALAEQLAQEYGFRPMVAGLFDTETFWFYMVLEGEGQSVQIPLPEDLTRAALERAVDAAFKRFSGGVLRSLALHTPEPASMPPQMGPPPAAATFGVLRDVLQEEHTVQTADLADGSVPEEADLLILAAPRELDEKQLFAVDQFLMQGGTVVVSTSPFDVNVRTSLAAEPQTSGLEDWLRHHGIEIREELVLDRQNAAFPIPVERRIGAFVVQETQMVEYPYFVDVRRAGIDDASGLAGGLEQVTLHWPSPIEIDADANQARRVVRLLESSPQSWTSDDLELVPNPEQFGELGFAVPPVEEQGPSLLAAVVEGRFDSYFAGKPSPLLPTEGDGDAESDDDGEEAAADDDPVIARVIERSPESARLIVFASSSFLTDSMLDLASAGLRTEYLNPVQLVANAVDWSLEDRGLLALRGRAQFSRTLAPISRERQVFWEYGNYAAAGLGLLVLWALRGRSERNRRLRYEAALNPARA